jgi:uncharacterized SAM-binding protein YcdF (DUF218 family)
MTKTDQAVSDSPAGSRFLLTRRFTIRLALVIVLLLLGTGAIITFRAVGTWLIREDPLAPADAIVVLGGGLPARAERAAQLFRMGYARQVWVSRGESFAGELAKIGVHYIGEEEYNREILIREGVPESAVHIFPDPVEDTEQELQEVRRQTLREHDTSVIIVTSPQHTRRVRALWKTIVGEGPKLIVRAAWEDPFDSRHWWRNKQDALSVTREVLGLLNVWTGLHVRPHVR